MMEWLAVVGFVVFIVGIGIVTRDAIKTRRKTLDT
jgi:hypothetical protein